MVGLCGSCGSRRRAIEPIAASISRFEGNEHAAFGEGNLRGRVITHGANGSPADVPGEETSISVWGEVYSRERSTGYERRPAGVSTATFCARAYAEDGIEALTELNGEYVCVVDDRDGGRTRIVTDRLGARPVYYHAAYGTITFSTSIQALVSHPGIEARYDSEFLAEYLGTKTVRGRRTPLAGIYQLPPASVATLDPDDGRIETERYWQPVHRPERGSISTFVDRFVDQFLDAVEDRVRPERRHGLLLSGGSDSRLVLSALDRVETYGFVDPADEVETARRAADVADAPFTRFDRNAEFDRRLFRRNTRVSNFVGWFNEGRAIGVETALRREVDALVSGLYADVLFKGWTIPTRRLTVPGGSIPMPLARRVETRESVLETRQGRTPPYLPDGVVERVQDRHLSNEPPVLDHGIAYSSYGELARQGFWYPLTNETSFDRYSDGQVRPTVYPFLDRRLVDLSLRLPREYALRYNIVDRAVTRLAPELAAIAHDESGVALSRPRWLHRLGAMHAELRSDAVGNAVGLREADWVDGVLERHEPTIRALPLIEFEAVRRTYDEHVAGADHTAALYGLLTLLETPTTELATADARPSAR